MNSKQPPSIRLFGQRPIPSSFLLGSSNGSHDSKEGAVDIRAPNKKLRASLSDFLDRKLPKSSGSPKAIKGKVKPFLSPVGRAAVSGSNEARGARDERGGSKDMNDVLEKLVFEKSKPRKQDNEDCEGKHGVDQVGSCAALEPDELESRKRRNPFQGGDDRHGVGVVVLGDDPKPKQRFGEFTSNNKRKPLYNHYANGNGWWDFNMEGVDNEEVGCSEVWEGVGTTTLGGLDWH